MGANFRRTRAGLDGSRMKNTIRVIDSKCYDPDSELKDSVDQDTRTGFFGRDNHGHHRTPARLLVVAGAEDLPE